MQMSDEWSEAALKFLQTLYPDELDVWGYVCRPVKGKRYFESRWFRHSQMGYGPYYAQRWSNEGSNVYFGNCWSRDCRGNYQRGTNYTVTHLPGFWADVDVAGHLDNNGQPSGEKYPPTEVALAAIKAMPLQPSLIIHSGGGLYPYWLLYEPFEIKIEEDRDRIASSLKRWQALLRQKLPAEYSLDATADLARVLRLLGTTNQKYGVTVRLYDPGCIEDLAYVKRYCLDQLEEFLPAIEPKPELVIPSVVLAGVPDDDQKLLERAFRAKNGDKLREVFLHGELKYVDGDHSRADLTLCAQLAYWSGPDVDRLDRLFRESKLFREKWDQIHYSNGDTYGGRTILTALSSRTDFFDWTKKRHPPAWKPRTIGAVTLRQADPPRKTDTKLVVKLEVCVGEKVVDIQTITDAASSRKTVARELLQYVGDITNADKQAEATLNDVLVEARELLAQHEKESAVGDQHIPTIAEKLKEIIPDRVRFLYRTDKGAFSEVLEQVLNRSKFVDQFTNNEILTLISTAADAPTQDDGQLDRQRAMKLLEQELKYLYGDLIKGLPSKAEAPIGANSVAGRHFDWAVKNVWTRPANMEINKRPVPSTGPRSETIQLAARCSLVSKAKKIKAEASAEGRDLTGKWHPIQDGYDAWIRQYERDGELVDLLAMRFELFGQIGTKIEDVVEHAEFVNVGKKYGELEPPPPKVPVRVTGGERIAILSRRVTEYLLAEIDETLEEDEPQEPSEQRQQVEQGEKGQQGEPGEEEAEPLNSQ